MKSARVLFLSALFLTAQSSIITAGKWDFLKLFLIVKNSDNVIIEHFGKFSRLLKAGFHWKLPFIQTTRPINVLIEKETKHGSALVDDESFRIDMREQLHNVPPQSVITQDNVMMTVSALVYYKITDPCKAVYEVQNLPQAVISLTQTVLRNKIGQMYLDKTLTARKEINEELKAVLDEATKPWGILMTRFELQSVNPPKDIQHAMELQMSAERNRRASILDAEGAKRASILRAEGERDSVMIKAEGEKQAAIIKADGDAEALKKTIEAEAISLERITKALDGGDAARYMLAQKYLLTLPEVTRGRSGKTVVIPYDTASLSSLMNIINESTQKK